MPYRDIDIPPGIDRESTSLSSGLSWYDANNVRWRDKYVETIGGWSRDGTYELNGIGRAMHSWTDFIGNRYRCVGTSFKFYLISGSVAYDITPKRGTSKTATNVITTTNGSSVVQITDSLHGAFINDFIVFETIATSSVNGIANSEFTSNKEGFQIIEIVDDSNFKVDIGGSLATASGTDAGSVTFHYKIHSGINSQTSGPGWGAGEWGGDDRTPTEFSLPTDPVTTLATSKNATIDITGSGMSTFVVNEDFIYLTGLTGSIGSLDLTFLNNKWWEAKLATTTSVTIYTGIQSGVTAAGGGSSVKANRYDSASGTVLGATRGWGDASTSSVASNELRTMSIANFGEDLMISARGGPIYYYDVSANVSSSVPSDAAYARELSEFTGSVSPPTVIDSFVVSESHGHTIAFGANDIGASTQNSMLIRWSDRHNPFKWLPGPDSEAGGEVLRHGTKIMIGVPTRDEIIVFTDSALYSMRYVGYPEIYGVNLLSSNFISFTRMGAVSANDNVYFVGNDRFYVYDGSIRPLPRNVSNYMFDDINEEQKEKVFAGTNSEFSEVIWFYPDSDSYEPNRYVSYNYSNGSWSIGSFDMLSMSSSVSISNSKNRCQWDDSAVFDNPASVYILDYDPTSTPRKERSAVMNHEVGNSADGSDISHYVESGEVEIDDGNRYAFYDKIIPDIKLINLSPNTIPSLTVSLSGRSIPGKVKGSESSVTVDYSPQSDSSLTYAPDLNEASVRGRERSVAVKVSSNTSGFGWRLGTMRIRFRPDGRD